MGFNSLKHHHGGELWLPLGISPEDLSLVILQFLSNPIISKSTKMTGTLGFATGLGGFLFPAFLGVEYLSTRGKNGCRIWESQHLKPWLLNTRLDAARCIASKVASLGTPDVSGNT